MNRADILALLKGADDRWLFDSASRVRREQVGPRVYLRGLIEASNICSKDCLYCGIRRSNTHVDRYLLTREEILSGVRYALEHNYGSVVIQAGEVRSERFVSMIEQVLGDIQTLSGGALGVTLSLGEQSIDTYRRWREAGAHRYLLRIESSNPSLFSRIHPLCDSWSDRYSSLLALRELGYVVGSGVMIGFPFQCVEDLVDDLLFFVDLDLDMCGMGPYVEHKDAPLSAFSSSFSVSERVDLTLRMISLLRLLMPRINIAATTALHTLDPLGREKGVLVGANVLMPNVTSASFRDKYSLYTGKVTSDLDLSAFDIGWGEWGDSLHFSDRF